MNWTVENRWIFSYWCCFYFELANDIKWLGAFHRTLSLSFNSFASESDSKQQQQQQRFLLFIIHKSCFDDRCAEWIYFNLRIIHWYHNLWEKQRTNSQTKQKNNGTKLNYLDIYWWRWVRKNQVEIKSSVELSNVDTCV